MSERRTVCPATREISISPSRHCQKLQNAQTYSIATEGMWAYQNLAIRTKDRADETVKYRSKALKEIFFVEIFITVTVFIAIVSQSIPIAAGTRRIHFLRQL